MGRQASCGRSIAPRGMPGATWLGLRVRVRVRGFGFGFEFGFEFGFAGSV